MKIDTYKRSYQLRGVGLENHLPKLRETFGVRKHPEQGVIFKKSDLNDIVAYLRKAGVKRISMPKAERKPAVKNVSVMPRKKKTVTSSAPIPLQRFYFSLYRQNPNSVMAKAFIETHGFTNEDMNRVLSNDLKRK